MTAPRHGQPQPPEYARNYPPERYEPRQVLHDHAAAVDRTAAPGRAVMTGAGAFWYVLQCIAFGAGYFAKVPAKKALQDAGMAQMTAAEKFWYVVQCIAFGAGYFAKLPIAKALTEMR